MGGAIRHNPIAICSKCSGNKKLKHALIDLAIQRELEIKMADIDAMVEVIVKLQAEGRE